MTNISSGSSTLPLTGGVLHARRNAAFDDDTPGRWSPAGVGATVASGAATIAGLGLVASGRMAVGAPLAAVAAVGTIAGATHLRDETDPSSSTVAARLANDDGGGLSVRYGDVDDPRLARPGSDLTNRPAVDLRSNGTAQAREGVVQLRSDLGDLLDVGSGWVVEPGLVVTNHHVIANSDTALSFRVRDHRGVDRPATVVADDPEHDLALVEVPGLTARPLPMDDVVERGDLAHVTGYPGGNFRESLAVALMGADVIDHGFERDGLIFAGRSAPGASGGPMINASGEVVSTTFAIGAQDISTREYRGPIVMGITNDDVRKLVESHAAIR